MNNIRFDIHTVVFNYFFFFLVCKYLVRSFESLMVLRPLWICNLGLHRMIHSCIEASQELPCFLFLIFRKYYHRLTPESE